MILTMSLVWGQGPANWTVNEENYEFFLTITATLEISTIPSSNSADVIAAFAGDECRGLAQVTQVLGQNIFFLLVHGDLLAEVISFKTYHAALDTVLLVDNQIIFTPGAALGTIEAPMVLTAFNSLTYLAVENDVATLDEDDSTRIDVLANDTFFDTAMVNLDIMEGPENGQALITSDHKISYYPFPNYFGNDTLYYVLSNDWITDTAAVSISIAAVNDAPVPAILLEDSSMDEDGILSISYWATDVDGDILNYQVSSDTLGVAVEYLDSSIVLSPQDNWYGIARISIWVSDSDLTLADTFMLSVQGVNDAPESFALLFPQNGTIVSDPDSSSQSFAWQSALDMDDDAISYWLVFSAAAWDTSIHDIATTAYRFNIEGLPRGIDIRWWVMAFDQDTSTVSLDTNMIQIHEVVGIDKNLSIPDEYALPQNYPNPFNPATMIRYGLPEMADVSLAIYDIRGRQIKSWRVSHQAAGWYDLTWNGVDESGQLVSTGLYLTRLHAGSYTQVIKMLYLK